MRRLTMLVVLTALVAAPAEAALIVNENSAWPTTPAPTYLVTETSPGPAVRNVINTRDLAQTFDVTSDLKLEKFFLKYRGGTQGRDINIRIFEVADVDAGTLTVGNVLLSLPYTTTSNIITGTSDATVGVMEFQLTGLDQITLTPRAGVAGYALQIQRVGADISTAAFGWRHDLDGNTYGGGRAYENYGSVSGGMSPNSDLTLALVGSPVPEPSTACILVLGGIGLLGIRRLRTARR